MSYTNKKEGDAFTASTVNQDMSDAAEDLNDVPPASVQRYALNHNHVPSQFDTADLQASYVVRHSGGLDGLGIYTNTSGATFDPTQVDLTGFGPLPNNMVTRNQTVDGASYIILGVSGTAPEGWRRLSATGGATDRAQVLLNTTLTTMPAGVTGFEVSGMIEIGGLLHAFANPKMFDINHPTATSGVNSTGVFADDAALSAGTMVSLVNGLSTVELLWPAIGMVMGCLGYIDGDSNYVPLPRTIRWLTVEYAPLEFNETEGHSGAHGGVARMGTIRLFDFVDSSDLPAEGIQGFWMGIMSKRYAEGLSEIGSGAGTEAQWVYNGSKFELTTNPSRNEHGTCLPAVLCYELHVVPVRAGDLSA